MKLSEIYEEAKRKLDRDEITLGEFERMVDIEVEEVVRCKECKYSHMTYGGDCKYCDNYKDDDDYYIEAYFDGDHFCSYGERREP